MYKRRGLEQRVAQELATRPVVILEGARGVGKTSLARHLRDTGVLTGDYFSFADEATRALASSSPRAFVDELPFGSVVDEAQLIPQIQLQIKQVVDADSAPGRVLLTGSARIAKDQLDGSAPLAGRSTTLRLHPFTRSEREGTPISILSSLFTGNTTALTFAGETQAEILDEALGGGFPLLAARSDRINFIEDALPDSELGRRSRASVLETGRQLAARTAKPYVADQLTKDLGIDKRTIAEYVDLWERLMLVRRLQNWRPSHSSSVRAQRKLVIADIGLATAWGNLHRDSDRGPLFETLVINELIAQSWSDPELLLFHYREHSTHEVDLVLGHANTDELVGIEVKAASEVGPGDFKQLRSFRERSKGRMTFGYVFYTGDAVLPFGEGLWAIPIPALWGLRADTETTAPSLEDAAKTLTVALREHGNPSQLARRAPAVEARVAAATEDITTTLSGAVAQLGLSASRRKGRLDASRMPPLRCATAHTVQFAGNNSPAAAFLTIEAAPVRADRIDYGVWIGFRSSASTPWTTVIEFDEKVADVDFTKDLIISAAIELFPQLTETLQKL